MYNYMGNRPMRSGLKSARKNITRETPPPSTGNKIDRIDSSRKRV